MQIRFLKYVAFFLLTNMILSGCQKVENTSWDSDLVVPLAFGRIDIGDIVPDSLIVADENQLWHLILNENLTDFDLDSLVSMPDTVIRESFVVPIVGGPFPIPNGQEIINEEENNLIRVNDVELREIRVQSGFLEYSIKSYIDGYLTCTYEIPGVMNNNQGVLIETTTEPSTGDIPYTHFGSIDLSGYTFDLTGETGFMFNRLYTHLTISTAVDAPTQAMISGNDSVVVELKFVDPVISYARGYFGEQHYVLDESVDFSEDVNFPTGILNLENVRMNLNLTNYVGADARIQFNSLFDFNSTTNNQVELAHSPLYQPINLTRAFDQSGSIIPTSIAFEMNETNSNIDAFIENLPNLIHLDADVTINPLGDISDGNDFIYTANTLDAEMNLDIPLNVGMHQIQFVDTLDIGSSVELSADGHLYLNVDNWFPFTATCDAYLINEQGYLLDMLCKNQSIEAATETNVPGTTIPTHSTIDIAVDDQVITSFTPEHKIVIRLTLNTPDVNVPSGLYTSYKMEFQVVADGTITLDY